MCLQLFLCVTLESVLAVIAAVPAFVNHPHSWLQVRSRLAIYIEYLYIYVSMFNSNNTVAYDSNFQSYDITGGAL